VVVITLKETLSERGITQSELSKLAGLRPNTVSSLLNGSTRIEFETIEKIAKALNTDDIREIISLKQERGREKNL
jgi:transcriptional regulator, XRE family